MKLKFLISKSWYNLFSFWRLKAPTKYIFWGALFSFALAVLVLVIFLVLQKSKDIEVRPNETASEETALDGGATMSSLRGEPCLYGSERPYAVMLAEDAVARPLSGISSADIVIEMPVITGGINRMMALFQCAHPSAIGSVRSARHDFIPLAAGFDAILAHWGGSHFALEELKKGILDNIDALPDPFSAYYRKSGVPAPHNGFTSFDLLSRAAQGFQYRTQSTTFLGYERKTKEPLSTAGILRIKYPVLVSYEYEPSSGQYLRFRANLREKDALNQKQVRADVIAVVFAASRQVELEYNDVGIEGEGDLVLFEEGRRIEGRWRKRPENLGSPLEFLDLEGRAIPLVAGALFIQIAEPGTSISYP